MSGCWDGTLKVWDAEIGQQILTLRGHTDLVQSVAFSPDGKQIVSGSDDRTVKIWDAAQTTAAHLGTALSLPDTRHPFSPNGKDS